MTGMKYNKTGNARSIESINQLKTALTTFAKCEAVTDDGQTYSYLQLDNASDHLAQTLYNNLAVSSESIPEVFVLVASRSVEYIVAMLACWKLGVGVVPLAQETPSQRMRYILKDLNCCHVIVNPNIAVDIDDVQTHYWNMVTESVESVGWQRADRDLAYIIYTSGTSGNPKGCAVGLNSLLPMAQSFNQYYDIDATSRMSFAASIAFDAAMMEWLPALLAGACLTIIDEMTLLNPVLLVRFYQRHKITFSWLPTPVAEILMKDEGVCLPSSLQTLQTAGQRLTVRPPAHWHTRVENAYGPTETTVITTSSPVTAEGKGLPDIGRPLPGVNCYVLDENRQPVADGQTGELYIGGIGVSRGYHNRPDLNREKFVELVVDNVTQRVYASGDMCRVNRQGNLEFIERIDQQVKVNGYRIELGEIAWQMSAVSGVAQAHAICLESANQPCLVGYYSVQNGADVSPEHIREHLLGYLPSYMIPAHFIVVEAFALTPNGKLDITALPQISIQADVLPQNIELTFEQATFLGVFTHHVGSHLSWQGDFFSAGGNSVAAISIGAQLHRQLSLVLSYAAIEQYRTPERIWASIHSSECGAALPVIIESRQESAMNVAPLSASQRSVWFLANLDNEDRAYHAKAQLCLNGTVNADAMAFALQSVVNRHEIFRTTFVSGQGDGLQRVHPYYQVEMSRFDYCHLPDEKAQAALQQLVMETLNGPFKLDTLPLVRWALVKINPNKTVLVHIEHHLVHDGWSYHLFLADLVSAYRAFLDSTELTLPMPKQYADFCCQQAKWIDGEEAAAQRAYWLKTLQGAPAMTNLPRRLNADNINRRAGQTIRMQLPRSTWQKMTKVAQQRGETAFSMVLAVFNVVLSRYSGDQDISVGSAFANRHWVNADEIIGMMINTVVLRTQFSPDMTLDQLMAACFTTVNKAQTHQALPFDHVVNALNPTRVQGINPLFQVFLGFHDSKMPSLDLPGIESTDILEAIDSQAAKFDLSVVLIPREGQLGEADPVHVLWEFKTAVFSPWLIEQMMASFNVVLTQCLDNWAQIVNRLSVGCSQLNGPPVAPQQSTLVSRILQRAELIGSEIAVQCEARQLNYDQLADGVKSKARFLVSSGIRTGDRVGVHLNRGIDLVVWMLAVQAAGAAYIPLDPAYPASRIRYIIKHSKMAAVIADESMVEVDCPLINPNQSCDDITIALPQVELHHAMYVIYTSGSTGQPKGVVISHYAFNNFITGMSTRFALTSESLWLAVTSCSFDISTLELYLPLLQGARILLASSEQTRDAQVLRQLIDTYPVTHCQATPTSWRSLMAGEWQPTRQIIGLCGGEALDSALAKTLLAANVRLFNLYGPTETTVWSTMAEINADNAEQPPLGQPIDNTQVMILGEGGIPVPPGAIGQLWIGGDSLAQGYLFNQSLSDERFVEQLLSKVRRYYTGDLAALNEMGELVFHGRDDHQVKLNGYRIELDEVAETLRAHPLVDDAIVVVQLQGQYQQLVAFIVSQTADGEVLRQYCQAQLPYYMVPNQIAFLAALPLTPNGKIDRNALPRYQQQAKIVNEPKTPTEHFVVKLFCQALGLESLDINSGFFLLGGQSLMAMRLALTLEHQFNVRLKVSDFIALNTVAGIAGFIDAMSLAEPGTEVAMEMSI